MPTLSWNEIRSRATTFVNEWKEESSEHAEAKTFWDQFFNIFGISRRRIATFEEKVNKREGHGYIDLLWRGVMLVEHKSKGKDLDKAYAQAQDYFPGLRESDLPQYILVSDFEHFRLYDLEKGGVRNFTLEQLPRNIELFGFIAGYQQEEIEEQDPVNIHAAEKMGVLHDQLQAIGYTGHDLEVYLVRLLFCLFADDTGIFDKNYFRDYLLQETEDDGSDLGIHISQIFQVLNTPVEKRYTNLNESLQGFPYVNGRLFEEQLHIPSFDKEMRELLLDAGALDWGAISPAVFGSLFQSVMDQEERRSLGAHYTSEENIMKVIKPLFLDELWSEFKSIRGNHKRMEAFHEKLARLTFCDPACGCGNFLIIAYREIRLLEKEVIRDLLKGKTVLDIGLWVKVDVDQFYGIEIDEFSSQIAQVALWLIDHQMNMVISEEFGEYYVRLPLQKSPNVVNDNALALDWQNEVLEGEEASYLFGNPPFVGSSNMSEQQKEDTKPVFKRIGASTGQMDFVAGWFIKAVELIQGKRTRVGFVATNSIVQGEQATSLWHYVLKRQGAVIEFAHQTFQWKNEARGKAAVYCVIIGFSKDRHRQKYLYTYPDIKKEPLLLNVKNINQYLLEAPTVFVSKRTRPIHNGPSMLYGTKPADGKNFLFKEKEMQEFIQEEPESEKYFKSWIGAHELVNSYQRYCLYLANCSPLELKKMPKVLERVEAVRKTRLESKKPATQKWADYPTQFTEDRVTNEDILIVPSVTSENRQVIPMGYFKKGTIASNAVFQLAGATPYLFGVLNSSMHMAWMRTVAGRLKGDYRYSNTLVYNTFPFPSPNNKQKTEIEKQANFILEVREKYLLEGNTLADLYDSITMPGDLKKVHADLDRVIDRAYGFRKEKTDEKRMELLLEKYVKLTKAPVEIME